MVPVTFEIFSIKRYLLILEILNDGIIFLLLPDVGVVCGSHHVGAPVVIVDETWLDADGIRDQ